MTIDTLTEETCPYCQGTGKDYQEYSASHCPYCLGEKTLPKEEAKTVRFIMENYLNVGPK